MDHAKLDKHRRELVKASELWQFDLMKPQKLMQFSKDRDINIFNADTIKNLWRAGLLRADAITAANEVNKPHISFVAEDEGTFLYCDERPAQHQAEGYGGIFSKQITNLDGLELHFHPFRLYVLYHIDRVFSSTTTSTQYLRNPEGLINLSKQEIEHLDHWSSKEECAERFEHWNRIAELGVTLEPNAYDHVFHSIRWQDPDTKETILEKLEERRKHMKKILSALPIEEITTIRQELGRNAEIIDGNKSVHMLLRLMAGHERLKLRSSLGACMLFLSMAEIIRRAVEDATGDQLPEEDEIGFGQWMDGARKSIYGAERFLDAPRQIQRNFLTSMGLDYGVKVRCYLEGETELGAMISAVGDGAGVEFINLKGQFLEKKGKGLNFLASLKNDKKSHVFSIVLLDGDSSDNVRALKKAAKDNAFFGRFFISSPDIEFHNFTVEELVDTLLLFAAPKYEKLPSRSEILTKVSSACSGKEFFDALKDTVLCNIDKGQDWGSALMKYAIEHPKFLEGQNHTDKNRTIIEAAQLVVTARRSGYARSLDRYKVDHETGELCKKQT